MKYDKYTQNNAADLHKLLSISNKRDIKTFEVLGTFDGEDGEGAIVEINGVVVNFGGELGFDDIEFIYKWGTSKGSMQELVEQIQYAYHMAVELECDV